MHVASDSLMCGYGLCIKPVRDSRSVIVNDNKNLSSCLLVNDVGTSRP